jgi:hypothetical protein
MAKGKGWKPKGESPKPKAVFTFRFNLSAFSLVFACSLKLVACSPVLAYGLQLAP